MICGGLALSLDQDRDVERVLAIPAAEWLKDLETIRRGGHLNVYGGSVSRRGLVSIVTGVESTAREGLAARRRQHELIAILILELVS